MQPVKVESEHLAAIGHDEERNILVVGFKNGEIYHYHNVSPETFQAMLNAPSKGIFLHSNIIGKYPHQKISSKK